MLKVFNHSRLCMLSVRFNSSSSSAWKEVRIPVPWGHVAGKWWGPQDKRPIIVTHGLLDNSGSFDRLIPLLPKHNSFLAIDFPGCGYSSKLPPGVFYHFIDSVILIRRLMKYFNWKKTSFLGHSMGAMVNYIYSMLYPEEIEFLICLDGFTPFVQSERQMEHIRKGILDFLKYDHLNNLNQEPPSYSSADIQQKFYKNVETFLDYEMCKYILERNTKVSANDPSKYYFSVDPRLKVYRLLGWPENELVDNAHRMSFPIMLMKTSNSPFFKRKDYAVKTIDAIAKHNKNLEILEFEGKHHLHLNNPEHIEGALNQFLKKFDVGNRSESGFKDETLRQ